MWGLLALAGLGVAGWYGYEKIYKGLPGVATPAQLPPRRPPPGVVGFTPAVPPPKIIYAPPGVQTPQPPFDLSGAVATGAWQHNAGYIRQYQGALTYLAGKENLPALDPQGVDGIFGPHTMAAVKAFQTEHSLVVDGEAGKNTASALALAVASA